MFNLAKNGASLVKTINGPLMLKSNILFNSRLLVSVITSRSKEGWILKLKNKNQIYSVRLF